MSIHESLEFRHLSKSEIDRIADAICEKYKENSFEYQDGLEHSLKWVCESVPSRTGPEQRVFLRWFDKDGKQVSNDPIIRIVMPPGPIDGVYISIDDVFRYDSDVRNPKQRCTMAAQGKFV